MRKGNQLKIKGTAPFCGREGIVKYSWPRIYRHLTEEEVNDWYDSPAAMGMNCAGETKLPPTCTRVNFEGGTLLRPEREITKEEEIRLSDDTFTVVRARCAPILGYSKSPGMCLVRNNRTGEEGYIKRKHCAPTVIEGV